MSNKSGIIHLLPLVLVGVIIASVGGYFWYQQNSNQNTIIESSSTPTVSSTPTASPEITIDTNDWKTFLGDGFSFKYPQRFSLISEDQIVDPATVVKNTDKPSDNIKVSVVNLERQTFDQYIQKEKDDFDNGFRPAELSSKDAKDMTVGKSLAVLMQTDQDKYLLYIYDKQNSSVITLNISIWTDKFASELDYVLDSFEFINKTTSYTCPTSQWVNCMPGPQAMPKECDSEFLSWAKDNCEDFKGAAY